jgi:hypothetical protein
MTAPLPLERMLALVLALDETRPLAATELARRAGAAGDGGANGHKCGRRRVRRCSGACDTSTAVACEGGTVVTALANGVSAFASKARFALQAS